MLTRLRPAAPTPADSPRHRQYRAFALIALGRRPKPARDRRHRAARSDVACRPARAAAHRDAVREAVNGPARVLRQRLAAARALYAEKSYDAAAEAFTTVLLCWRIRRWRAGPPATSSGRGAGDRFP